MASLWRNAGSLLGHAGVTALEIVLGMALGTLLGFGSALALGYSRRVRRWLLPVLIASQAIPVFAIAPVAGAVAGLWPGVPKSPWRR